MLEKENIILKKLNEKIDQLSSDFKDKFKHFEIRVDARMLLIAEKVNSSEKRVNGRIDSLDVRMERLEESNRKNGVLLERLEGKFDLSVEGYSSLKERTDKIEDRVSILEGRG